MPALTITLDWDGPEPELVGKMLPAHISRITAVSNGMESGAPSVAILIPLDDGRVVFAETSLKLLLTAADAFKARYGDPRE